MNIIKDNLDFFVFLCYEYKRLNKFIERVRSLPIPKVSDIRYFKCKGPWDTKSGGVLNVLFAIPDEELAGFFVKSPISGFRIYQVSNPEIEKPGGMEWHIYRQEIV